VQALFRNSPSALGLDQLVGCFQERDKDQLLFPIARFNPGPGAAQDDGLLVQAGLQDRQTLQGLFRREGDRMKGTWQPEFQVGFGTGGRGGAPGQAQEEPGEILKAGTR
jgi:hypothetical protein